MWLLLVFVSHTELLISQVQGQERLILKGEKDPCHGHVKIFYKNEWGYVGDQDWNRATEEVVCRSTHCGSPVEGATEDVLKLCGPVWLNEVKCNGNETRLFDCKYPGQGISFYQKETVKKVKCSHKIQISLDGFKCAGAVQFSVKGTTQRGYFCAESWGQAEADSLCESLNCGKALELDDVHQWMTWKEFQKSKKMKLDCQNIRPVDNLWHCVTQEGECKHPASVRCTDFERLQLRGNTSNVCSGQLQMEQDTKWIPVDDNRTSPDVWCRHMNCGSLVSHSRVDGETQVTCTDNVSVVLMDRGKPSRCYGAVHVNINGATRAVCASKWTMMEAEVTCRELNCGTVLSYEKKSAGRGIMDNVHCLGSESSLWFCQAMRDIDMTCSTTAYVVCSGSLDVRLRDAPGRCAGRVEILHEGRWTQVSADEWTDENSDTVCRQVNCGERHRRHTSPEQQFGRSSADFFTQTLHCTTNTSSISDCFTQKSKKKSWEGGAVEITCDKHKVLILAGHDDPCSGFVGIVSGDDRYWLSGSTTTWNWESADAVCRQMHCGMALNFSATVAAAADDDDADVQAYVWDQSYNCSSDATSLFDCSTSTRSRDHNRTIATVSCSGTITVNMTHTCWGTVSVCLDGKCGGVCKDSWTRVHSEELCQSLGCGYAYFFSSIAPEEKRVIVKSLHATQYMSLSHSNFVMNREDEEHVCRPVYVVCSGSLKPRFSISRDKCSGNLEVFVEGQHRPVCASALQHKAAQHAICEELQCGRAANMIDYFGPKPVMNRVISNVHCSTTGIKSLSDCNIIHTNGPCSPTGLRCSDWRKFKVSETCRGAVSIHSDGRRSAVAIDGWTETEGQRLCQDLKCGNFKSKKVYNTSQKLSFWNESFSCGNDSKNIWDCAKPASFSQRQQLFIECQDEPNITLSGKCHGFVKINEKEVCNRNWNINYSHMVCQEQKCSNAIVNSSDVSDPNTDYYHVKCDDFHYKLGQCMRVRGKCDAGLVIVNCVGNIKFSTTEKCGGRLLINYQDNSLEEMCPLNLATEFKEKLCHELGCDGYNDSIVRRDNTQPVTLKMALECTDDHKDIKYCVTQKLCKGVNPATIYCNGYIENDRQRMTGGITLPLILGVGLFLAVLIVMVIFIRICIIRKAKNVLKFPERNFSRKEVQFESGDYEDVSKINEMAELRRSRFRSEAEVETENDARSVSSYDDIDEAVEAQPLTSHHAQGFRSEAEVETENDARSVSSYDDIDEAVEPHHAQDAAKCELDDSHENYDDIQAGPDIIRTSAEVHHSPTTTGVGGAVAPPGSVGGQGDYV